MNREYKYNIGDVVVIKHLHNKVGVVLQKDYFARNSDDKIGVPGYRVMICGLPSKTFIYYENEIEKL